MPGVVFVNPSSGPGNSTDEIADAFAGHQLVAAPGDEFATRLEDALGAAPDFVGVAGGDGTIRSAAQIMQGGDVPMVVIPAGTRNHFAKSLGVATVDDARRAVTGPCIGVDLGDVNGHCFVNNAGLGLYPRMVMRREEGEERMPKAIANLVAASEQLARGRTFHLAIDAVAGSDDTPPPKRAWMVFVGNGAYGEGLSNLMARASLTDNVLDLRVVRADRRLARTRVVLALLTGRLERSPLVLSRCMPGFTVRTRRSTVEVALDGEVVRVDAPLVFTSRAGALRVLTPSLVA